MQPFTTQRGKLALLDWADVNTDLIIPARYLKRIERTGYGPAFFADKRYQPSGAPDIDNTDKHGALDPAFPLNDSKYTNATILVVGRNFGCGSSREHAVWAVAQAGFRVLIAPGKGEGYADIFEQNAFNNGLLPIELPERDWHTVAKAASQGAEATVDLEHQTITLQGANPTDTPIRFEVEAARRQRLLAGLDAIAETQQHAARIDSYERSAPSWATLQPRS